VPVEIPLRDAAVDQEANARRSLCRPPAPICRYTMCSGCSPLAGALVVPEPAALGDP